MLSQKQFGALGLVLAGALLVSAVVLSSHRSIVGKETSPSVLSSDKAPHGSVASQSLASSILAGGKAKYEAKQKQTALKKIAAKHAAHKAAMLDGFTLDKKATAQLEGKKEKAQAAPTSSLLKRLPVYLKKGGKAAATKTSRAAKLESEIAGHKLTTRGLIAAVQKAEKHQMSELNEGLKDQTDDLIIAKINQLRQKKTSTQSYVLSNALTKGDRQTLKASKKPASLAAAPSPAGAQSSLQGQNKAILKATSGSKGGNPEGMLSSYDQQLLSGGPDSISTSSLSYKPPQNAQQLSQMPEQAAPAYQPQQAPYQQAYQYPQAQPQQMYEQPEPMYQQPPQYQGMYQQPPQYQGMYQQPQPAYQQPYGYQPAPYQQMYQQPEQQYAQAYQQPYQAPQAAYQAPQAPYQALQQQAPVSQAPKAAAPMKGPTPPESAGGNEYGESAAVSSHQYNGASGDKLWKIFSSGDSQPPALSGGSAATGMLSQTGDGLSSPGGGIGGGSSLSSGMGGGSSPGENAGPLSNPGAAMPKGATNPSKAKNLSPQAKAAIAAQMQQLRQSIMSDFSSTTAMGKKAGYLPPPPV